MPTIPNNLHFIWVGKEIPVRYSDNIMQWVVLNPLYTCNLWTQHVLFEQNLSALCHSYKVNHAQHIETVIKKNDTEHGVQVSFFDEKQSLVTFHVNRTETLIPLTDPMLLAEELTTWKNYGAASDTLRHWIVYQFGGIYMDTDTYSDGKSIPCDITAPYGYLEHTRYLNGQLTAINCILAAEKENYILKTVAERHEKTYYDEYIPQGAGVMEFSEWGANRLKRVNISREGLLHPEDTGMSQEYLQRVFRESFSAKTAGRNRRLLKGLIPDVEFISFEIQSGYAPIVASEGSWRSEGEMRNIFTKAAGPTKPQHSGSRLKLFGGLWPKHKSQQ